jgi:hypothetical protein
LSETSGAGDNARQKYLLEATARDTPETGRKTAQIHSSFVHENKRLVVF